MKRTRELGSLDAGKRTLAELGDDWWRLHAEPNLAARTLTVYASLWDVHILPRLGALPLRELRPETCHAFAADLAAAGVGPAARRKALALLSSVLEHAVEWGQIASNPAARVRKPSARRVRVVRPPAPAAVEAMRSSLIASQRLRDATLVSVLAYAGLRPGEALALRWEDVGQRTLLIEPAVAAGEIQSTKTGQRRSVRLLSPLRSDLAAWRLASGRPPVGDLLFARTDGRPFTETDWRHWRRRVFEPVAQTAGLSNARPYDLRHAYVSLLMREGASIVEVARQAGHSPTMTLDTYGHVFAELERAEKVSAEAEIRRARDELVPVSYLEEGLVEDGRAETPANKQAQHRTRTDDPFLTMEVLYQLS